MPAPAEFFDPAPGEDGGLLDLDAVLAYLELLGERTGRIEVRTIGTTTEGRPLQAAFLSSQENLARLESIADRLSLLADSRRTSRGQAREIARESPLVFFIGGSIHSDEVGPVQWAPVFAHWLAAGGAEESRRIRDGAVIILVPCLNPDGYHAVRAWAESVRGTPHERSPPPFLYHRYCGHDLNRDWFAFTQPETRAVARSLIDVYHPQVVFDLHQMGQDGYRFFAPPYRDPVEPNVDPGLLVGLQEIGAAIATALVAEGKRGAVHGEIFDAWTPARAYAHYRGAPRVLLEAASTELGWPVALPSGRLSPAARNRTVRHPHPWTGGRWGVDDVIAYFQTAVVSALLLGVEHRESWLLRYHEVFRRAIEEEKSPELYGIPAEQHDPEARRRLIEILLEGGVEMQRTREATRYRDRSLAPSLVVIDPRQPYGPFARCLLDATDYPATSPEDGKEASSRARGSGIAQGSDDPYDASTHCLPHLMGVEVLSLGARGELVAGDRPPVLEPFPAPVPREPLVLAPPGDSVGKGESSSSLYTASRSDTASYRLVSLLLAGGREVLELTANLPAGSPLPLVEGTFVVPALAADALSLAEAALTSRAQLVAHGPLPREAALRRLRLPRVACYTSSVPAPDAGWTRFVLESHGFPVTLLDDVGVRKGVSPARFDTVILPHQEPAELLDGNRPGSAPDVFCGGLGAEGMTSLLDFVEEGGTLVALGDSARVVASSLRHGRGETGVKDVLDSRAGLSFDTPGALLRVHPRVGHALTRGLPEELAIFHWGGTGFRGDASDLPILYAARTLRILGRARSGWVLAGTGAVYSARRGKGRVVLIGFRPQFRAWTTGSFKILFNALLESTG